MDEITKAQAQLENARKFYDYWMGVYSKGGSARVLNGSVKFWASEINRAEEILGLGLTKFFFAKPTSR